MPPLVSVMVPCYNSTKTLPFALASLLSQTYPNWECILVDDGSIDNPLHILEVVDDNRIRFHRFESNQGRGAARQQAMKMANGDYLCMLDADDWLYPWKLEHQVTLMEKYFDLAVLSTCMATVDGCNNIIGIRGTRFNSDGYSVYEPTKKPITPLIAFAPSMIRASVAKSHDFDNTFMIAEDKDYLMRLLLKHRFATMNDILYVYREIESITLEKITHSLMNNRKMYLKYIKDYPLKTFRNYILSLGKELIYIILFTAGFGDNLIRRRSVQPTLKEKKEFEMAREIVSDTYNKIFTNIIR